jgi:hypothetical protein
MANDIFISFKNLDDQGRPTRDFEIAAEVHDYLTSKGLSVFFSAVSLERLGQSAYKRAIDDALDEASVVVAVGTTKDHLESKWVRYEWDGFFNDILGDAKPEGRVFTYVEGLLPKQLPRSLRQTQTFLHSPPDSLQKLYNFITAGAIPSAENEAQNDDATTTPILLDKPSSLLVGGVFLSYDRADVEVAERIFEALQNAGVSVWFDRRAGLIPGDSYDQQVRNAMNHAACFIPIISRNTESRQESWTFREWDLAAQRMQRLSPGRCFILPVVVGDLQRPQHIPETFKRIAQIRMDQDVPEGFIVRVVQILDQFARD